MNQVQVGLPITREINLDPGLFVAMTVMNSAGTPIGSKIAMTNVIDTLYLADYIPPAIGNIVIRVAAYTDGTFATLLPDAPRSSMSYQVVDLAALLLDAILSSYQDPGSVGEALGNASGGSSGSAQIIGFIGSDPIIGSVEE